MAELETKDQLASNWSLVFWTFLTLMNPFAKTTVLGEIAKDNHTPTGFYLTRL